MAEYYSSTLPVSLGVWTLGTGTEGPVLDEREPETQPAGSIPRAPEADGHWHRDSALRAVSDPGQPR